MSEQNEGLFEILIELAEIVCVLSDDPDYSFGWKAAEIVSKLKALRDIYHAGED